MWMFTKKRAIRVVAASGAIALVGLGPAGAVADQGGVPEVRRELQQEVADRKAADLEVARTAQASLVAVAAVLKQAIADGDVATAAAARAADEALRNYLEAAIANQAAATASAAQAANDKLEVLLRQVMAAGDAATLAEGKTYADGKVAQLEIAMKAYADAKSDWNKAYTDLKTDEAKADATEKTEKAKKEGRDYTDQKSDEGKKYADDKSDWNKKYTDDKSDWNKGYTDTKTDEAKLLAQQKADQAKSEAEADADAKAEAAKQAAKTHTDDAIAASKSQTKNESTSEAKAYTDVKTSQVKDESVNEAKTYTDSKIQEGKVYTDAAVSHVLPACDAGTTIVFDGMAWVCVTTEASASAASVRNFTVPSYALFLDDKFAGWMYSTTWSADADVIESRTAGAIHKNITGPRSGDLTVTFGPAGVTPDLWTWIDNMLAGTTVRKNAILYLVDYQANATSEIDLPLSVISEIDFPELDVTSKDACKFTLTIRPEYSRLKDASGKQVNLSHANLDTRSRFWTCRDFVLDVPGLSSPTHIDAFKATKPPVESPFGELRDYELQQPVQFSNLMFTAPLDQADSWRKWFDDFVIQGLSAQDNEKSGDLVFLRPDHGSEIGRVHLSQIGVFHLSLARPPARIGSYVVVPETLEMGLYVEGMRFTVTP
jgi:hypothetical protein